MPLTARKPSQHLVDLVGALGGHWHGHTAMCRWPAHVDKTPSLSLRQGDRGILVTCFAGCPPEEVLRELRRMPLSRRYAPPSEACGEVAGNAVRLWSEALPTTGTLAERYIAGRHLRRNLPDLRFHPRCPLGPKPKTKFKPALLVGIRAIRQIVAIQRIFLDPVTAMYTAKVMLSRPGQGAWQGTVPGETLALAEGFETAAAFTALSGIPCWASLGARRLDQLLIPATVTNLLIAEDNDAEGRRAAARAAARYARPGLTIERTPPPAGFKDWANVLDAGAERGWMRDPTAEVAASDRWPRRAGVGV